MTCRSVVCRSIQLSYGRAGVGYRAGWGGKSTLCGGYSRNASQCVLVRLCLGMEFWRDEFRLLRRVPRNPLFWLWGTAALMWAAAFGVFDNETNILHGYFVAVMALLLVAVSVVDLEKRLLPLVLVALIGAMGLIDKYFLGGLVDGVAAAAVAGGGLWGIGHGVKTYMKTKASLGFGDVLLVAALAPWVGLAGLAPMLFCVAVLGIIVLIYRRIMGVRQRMFAFGPVLALAAWVALLHGDMYWRIILG